MQYDSSYPANGYACTLGALGGDPRRALLRRRPRRLVQPDLATGFKSGYIFTIGNCSKVTVNGTDRITGYTITAVPQTVGKTGDRGFCSDQYGSDQFDPAGGTNCTQSLQ